MSLGIIVAILIPQLVVIAQEEVIIEETEELETVGLDPAGTKSGEITDCFETYRFGSEGVSITARTDLSEYKPYDLVEINGLIVNNNPYPVLDISVRARILRSHPDPVEQRALYTTGDDFEVIKDLSLKPQEEYVIDTYYNRECSNRRLHNPIYNQYRFNLNGLSFTEDIIGNSAEFRVEGVTEDVYLDKTNITVDGQINDTRGFITNHEKGKDIPVRLPLVNPIGEAREMEISYINGMVY